MTGASVSLLSGLQTSLLPLRRVQPLPEHTGGTLVPGHGLLGLLNRSTPLDLDTR
jgi:hypothetical protein